MRKRFAAHRLFIADRGYLKHQVVELEAGRVRDIYPLQGEQESTEWLPGIILLLPTDKYAADIERCLAEMRNVLLPEVPQMKPEEDWVALFFSGFDFTTMQLVGGTPHRQLR